MFLDLPKIQTRCEEFVNRASVEGHWSSNSISITNNWLREGLKPRCITRDLKWGTPVPLDHMKDKVLYVWFDAPIGYLSITANYTREWERWWKNPDQVSLYQFMGKDNVPFHTVIFPCTLLGTSTTNKWTMLHHLSTTEYLNYEDDKFSKSRGVGVFGHNVMESGIPVSVWRYYLLSTRPESSDSSFTWSDMGARTNNELLANLGNFVNRTLKFLKVKMGGVVPEVIADPGDEEQLIGKLNNLLASYNSLMENTKLRPALKTVMDISGLANTFLQDNKLDNALLEKNPKRCGTIIGLMCNVIYLLSALVYPFMPSTSAEICKQLNAPLRSIPDSFTIDLLPGHVIGRPDHLFKRLEEKTLQDLFMKYGGEAILKRRQELQQQAATAAKSKPANSNNQNQKKSSKPQKEQPKKQ
jgi:methionyl-tRNA synthetase